MLLAAVTTLGQEDACLADQLLGDQFATDDHSLLPWFILGSGYGAAFSVAGFVLGADDERGFLAGFTGASLAISLAGVSEPGTPEGIPAGADRECFSRGYNRRARLINTVAAATGGIVGAILGALGALSVR